MTQAFRKILTFSGRIVYCVFLISFAAVAQNTGIDIKYEKISVEQGLSHSIVNCILKDSKGFLWFGTSSGLNRFDGYNIKTFKTNKHERNTLNNNIVITLMEDKKGLLWVGTMEGVVTYNPETEKFTKLGQKYGASFFLKNRINKIFEDTSGNIWLATSGAGFLKYNSKIKSFEKVQGDVFPYPSVLSILPEKQNKYWVGGAGLGLWDCDKNKFEQILPNKNLNPGKVISIEEAGQNLLWIATATNGLFQMDKKTRTIFPINPSPSFSSTNKNTRYEIFCATKDLKDNLWVGTDQGIFVMDKYGTIKHNSNFEPSNRFKGNKTTTIYSDDHNIVWVGTFKAGVQKCDLSKKRFKTLLFEKDPSLNNISAVYQDKAGYLWIGTWTGGLLRYNRKRNEFLQIKANTNKKTHLPHDHVASIEEDKFGNLWLASWNGYITLIQSESKYSEQLKFSNFHRDTHSKIGFEGWSFRQVYKDRVGSMWIVSFDQGVFKVIQSESGKPEKFIQIHEFKGSEGKISNNEAWTMHEAKGRYWVGTESGLNKFIFSDKRPITGNQYSYTGKPNSLNGSVRAIYEDKKGNFWMGTGGGGLHVLDRKTGKFRSYTEKDGLPDNMIYGILEDKSGSLWISTENGISRFDPITQTFKNFDEKDGLQSKEFNIGASFKDPITGEMFFGGINGLTSFFPEQIKDNPYPPKIQLTDFKLLNQSLKHDPKEGILNKSIAFAEEINLTYKDYLFSFEFAGLQYASPDKNYYAYKMEDLDKNWIYTNYKNRTATYTNLDPGNYTFYLKAANRDGVWSEVKKVRINILPPFYGTWWFKCLAVLSVGGFILTFYKVRVNNIKKQKQALENLVKLRTITVEQQKAEIEEQKNTLAAQAEELIRMNEELQSKTEELEAQNEEITVQMEKVRAMALRIHEADEMKLQFFTNVSHEFRTPLTLIIGPLEKLFLNLGNNETIRNQFNSILRNARRLSHLIDQIMDIRKLESGSMKLQLAKGDIVKFIKKTSEAFRYLADHKNISFSIHSDLNRLLTAFDKDKVEKIIYNLLSNAFKFTPAGGKIDISTTLKELDGKSWLQIQVRDTGAGIPQNSIDKIFNRFYQVSESGFKEEGIGVGLALVKEIVDLHEGIIEVQSKLEAGSEFKIFLPVNIQFAEVIQRKPFADTFDIYANEGSERPSKNVPTPSFKLSEDSFSELIAEEQQDAPSSKNQLVAEAEQAVNNNLILVVEDNPEIRAYIKEVFEPDYKVFEASRASEGLKIAMEIIPDLILSDVMMPGMNGLEFCKKIKEEEKTSHIPIILLTARAEDEYKLKGLETGADDYIIKPFTERLLKVKVKNLIKSRMELKEKFSKELVLRPSDVVVNSREEDFLERAIKTIETHISDIDFTVEVFSKEMGLSHVQLYRKLQALTGQSPNEFIKSIRLQRAVQLLAKNRYSVSEVAYQVGFNDPSYFTRCFRKQFGKTPKAMSNEE